jgi:hypothetical protein
MDVASSKLEDRVMIRYRINCVQLMFFLLVSRSPFPSITGTPAPSAHAAHGAHAAQESRAAHGRF